MTSQNSRASIAMALALLVVSRFANAYVPAGQAAQQVSEAPDELVVAAGKSVIVNSALPIERVSVGFGDVAEASAMGVREILVNGKTPGQTSLIIWQQGGSKLFFDVTVQPSHFATDSRLDMLRRQLNKELPGQKIDVSAENDLVFLRGTVKDLNSSDRAVAIASALGKPVNLLYVKVPEAEPQIMLKVRFASVDRSLSNQLGANIFSLGATNTIGSTSTQQFSPPPGVNFNGFSTKGNLNTPAQIQDYTLSNALNLFFFRPDLDLGATIQALESKGLVQILAEPNVLAENGKQASFLAGGEYPYPVVQGATAGGTNAITIQFRQFGVRLNFIPTITPRGTIRLQVAPEVSSLDYTNALTLQGFTVPGVSVRNVSTEVELGQGQSFAIGGLLDNRENETLSKIPFIGDIPILGKLFQSRSLNKTNTELMVIVTPQIVHPTDAGQTIPGLKYPLPFMEPNTGHPMTTPNVAGPASMAAATATVPVETLIKSLQPETPLNASASSAAGSYGSGQQMNSTSTSAPK